MLCPNCKKEIENDSTFCEHCGTRIKKSKKGLWKILAVISAGFIIWGIINTFPKVDSSGAITQGGVGLPIFLAVILLFLSIIKILQSKTK